MPVVLISDSTCDISNTDAAALGLITVPLKVLFPDRTYREWVDFTPDEFYPMLAAAQTLPTTSQPSPEEYLEHYEAAKAAGSSVLVITLSSALSGSYQSAVIAKEMAGDSDIYIVDSLHATIGQRMLVDVAVRLRDEGKTAADIAAELERLKGSLTLFAMIDTLEYLHKGGRLSKSVTTIGTLLNMKPIITVKNSGVDVVGKSRGLEKCVDNIMELIESTSPPDLSLPHYYGYTGNAVNSPAFMQKLSDKYGFDCPNVPIGSVIGTHIGPGALAICYFAKL